MQKEQSGRPYVLLVYRSDDNAIGMVYKSARLKRKNPQLIKENKTK
jgi:hypothetical protein